MCGIAGLFLPRSVAPIDVNVEAMMAALRHRGPDGHGRYASPDKRYQAGFRRLAIIDLETGDQPIEDRESGRVMMGNGEIYNYLELRADACARGYPFRTKGDMEVVLALARTLGDDLVHRLNGIYAFALYDRSRHRLVLVRDRLGVKPLYWSRLADGGLVFASEVKALFASGLVARAVDEDSVSAYLGHGFVPAPATLYRGVSKLVPGQMLVADADGAIDGRAYWRPRPAEDLPPHPVEIRERMIGLLRDSLRLQMRADVPVGALLSGGIDSGLMVALAAEQSDRPLNTFTVRFEGAPVDESPLARAVAQRYGTRHTVLDLPAASATGVLARAAWYCDEPLNDAALVPNLLIEDVLAGRVKVALNGTGGDELFAGYGRYFPLAVERAYLALPAPLRRRVVEPAVAALCPMTAWKLARAAKFGNDVGVYLHDHGCHFPPPMRDRLGNRLAPPTPAQARAVREFEGSGQTAALYADLRTYLPDDLLTLLDRTTMAVGVEGRVPFLDHRLVEAALAVPARVRTAGGRQKALERAIAARFLPEEVLAAPKQGFASPVPAWLEAGLAPVALRILTRPRTLARGWWTAEGIRRLLARPRVHGFRIYTLLMLELAVRLHVEEAATAASEATLEALADAA